VDGCPVTAGPTWEELRLFELPGEPDVDVNAPGLSEGRRRTLRNQGLIEAGIHPATRLALRDGATCGSCAHLVTNGGRRGRSWFKCGLVPVTSGPGTDVRLSWPACQRWDEIPFRGTEDVSIKGEVL
jgi:hypothetical protein